MLRFQDTAAPVSGDSIWFTRLSIGAALLALPTFFESGILVRHAGTPEERKALGFVLVNYIAHFGAYMRVFFPIGTWLFTMRSRETRAMGVHDPICIAMRILSIAFFLTAAWSVELRSWVGSYAEFIIRWFLLLALYSLLFVRVRAFAKWFGSGKLYPHTLGAMGAMLVAIVVAKFLPETQYHFHWKAPPQEESSTELLMLVACIYASVILFAFAILFNRKAVAA